jgi:hypothetical protein
VKKEKISKELQLLSVVDIAFEKIFNIPRGDNQKKIAELERMEREFKSEYEA